MVLAHNINEKRRTTDIQITQDITFDNMLLAEHTLAGLKESGFFKPSPIQLHAIPLGKCGFDLLLEAKSGTGKTAVFSIISLEKLDLNKGLQVIILAPTREIAAQICDVIRQIGCHYEDLCVEVVMGGLSIQDDINKFKANKVHVVVGSPGRLKHLINDGHMDVNSVRLLVLDEADKLMENAFLVDIKYIHSSLPSQKQVILSSATYPEYTKEIINQFVFEAQHICPNSDCVLLGVDQKVTHVKHNHNIVKQTENRFKELLNILTKIQFKQCLIFCNYQTRVGELYKMLTKEKWPAEQLYGKQEQIDRLDALKTLQEYKCRLLISTDLAARGIDASNVDLVINFEPPFEWQTYLHRIGRAGRYGSYGMAITILSEGIEQKKFFNLLQQLKLSNLTPLWKDKESDNALIEESLPSLNTEETPNEKNSNLNCTDFWELLCGNKTVDKQTDMFESFDSLSKSFKELEINNIKSFSDLFTSYNNFNNNLLEFNDSMSQYKNIALPEVSTKSFLTQIKHIKDGKPHDQMCNDVSNSIDLNFVKNNENEISNLITAKSLQKNNYNCEKTSSCEIMNNTNEESMELKQLGLPNAFSSSKDKTKKKYRVQKDTAWSNKKSIQSKKSDILLKNVQPIPQCSLNLENKSKFTHTHIKDINSNNYRNLAFTTNRNSLVESNHVKNSYKNWYSHLKLKMKQIEMAVYIDELSRL